MKLISLSALLSAITVFAMQTGCSTESKKENSPPQQSTQPPEKLKPIVSAELKNATAAPTKTTNAIAAVKCVRSEESRLIEVDSAPTKGCTLWYTKFGQRANTASSTVGTHHCEEVARRIKENLQAAKFDCR